MASFEHRLPADATQAEVEDLLARLNADAAIDGILLQLPLPGHLDEQAAVATIDPAKDVDGLTPVSAGRLALGIAGMVPCTPYRSEEHTSELQSLMRNSYAVFCLKKIKNTNTKP